MQTSIDGIELVDINNDIKISQEILTWKQIEVIIDLFLISSSEAVNILTRNKVQSVNIEGLNITPNKMYFSIHEFARYIKFYQNIAWDNSTILENTYALNFYYLSHIIPKIFSLQSINSMTEEDIKKSIDGVLDLFEMIREHPFLRKYLDRWWSQNNSFISDYNNILHTIRLHAQSNIEFLKNIATGAKNLEFSLTSSVNSYDAFYTPLQKALTLLGEKWHPKMMQISSENLSLEAV